MKRVTAFHDFLCPYCYIGRARFQRAAREAEVETRWRGIEIHPEIPPGGLELGRLIPREAAERSRVVLEEAAREDGLAFRPPPRVPNTRLALEMAELAEERGRGEEFAESVYRAYWTEGRDVGNRSVLRGLGEGAGLDPAEVGACLEQRTHRERVEANLRQAAQLRVAGVPTFFVSGEGSPEIKRIVGAQDEEVFRRVLGG